MARKVARPSRASDAGALVSGTSTGPSFEASADAADLRRVRPPPVDVCDEALGLRLLLAFMLMLSLSDAYEIIVGAAADGGDGDDESIGAGATLVRLAPAAAIALGVVVEAEMAGDGVVTEFVGPD